MPTNNETAIAVHPDALFGEVQKNWGWLLALGILFVIFGIIGLGMLFTLTIASVLLFGILLLMGGGIQLFEAFKCKGWKGIILHVLIAILYVLAGIVIIYDPLIASTVLTLMLAGGLIGVGILRIIMAFQLRDRQGWVWPLLAGVLSIILGILIIAQWPVSGLWVIGLFVAIELLFHGWSYIFIALAARNAGKAAAAESGRAAHTKA